MNHGNRWQFLGGVRVLPERIPPERSWPFTLPFVDKLNLRFQSPVTFFVGENGTGKSTLVEALAVLCRFPASGGGRNELGDSLGPKQASDLSRALRIEFRQRTWQGYFFRAEYQAHFASLLDERKNDPDFVGDPYGLYGGRSLHTRSHGEAFLEVIRNRVDTGIYFFDEPESALSPQRQLALLTIIDDLVRGGGSQFIVATHSPILLTYPGAEMVNFDDAALPRIALEATSHYQITRGVLDCPGRYWRYLRDEAEDE